MNKIYQHINNRISEGKKSLALLIDPDKIKNLEQCIDLIQLAEKQDVNYLFVGGSLLKENNLPKLLKLIKSITHIPLILFPGSNIQIDKQADAVLFLSLISGRNPDLLIGQHVQAAPLLKRQGMEVIPTAYMLIDSGNLTSVAYISNTTPIPRDKASIGACTALAGEMLGLKLTYLEAGSGARLPVPAKMIQQVKKTTQNPVIVGGGINTAKKAKEILEAGADIIVLGNGVEKNPNLLVEVSAIVKRTISIS